MENGPVINKNQKKKSSHKIVTCSLLVFIVLVLVMLNGCASRQSYVPRKSKPKASHGTILKANDYSQKCPWHFFNGHTKKRCVRR